MHIKMGCILIDGRGVRIVRNELNRERLVLHLSQNLRRPLQPTTSIDQTLAPSQKK